MKDLTNIISYVSYVIKDQSFLLFFDYVRNSTKNRKEYINTALQIKNSNSLKMFRGWLNELDETQKEGNHKKLNKMLDKYDKVIDESLKTFGDRIEVKEARINIFAFGDLPIKYKDIDLSRTFAPRLHFVRKLVNKSITHRPME